MMGRRNPRLAVGIAMFAIAAGFLSQGKNTLAAAFVAIGIALIVAGRRRGGDAR